MPPHTQDSILEFLELIAKEHGVTVYSCGVDNLRPQDRFWYCLDKRSAVFPELYVQTQMYVMSHWDGRRIHTAFNNALEVLEDTEREGRETGKPVTV